MRSSLICTAVVFALGLSIATPSQSYSNRSDALSKDSSIVAKSSNERSMWIVVFDEPAAASFKGFPANDKLIRPKLAATNPAATGKSKYEAKSAAAKAYTGYLAQLREDRLREASAEFGRTLTPKFVYEHALNGFALELTAAEASSLQKMQGVKRVQPDFVRQTQTDRGPAWVKAPSLWNGSAGVASRGESVVLGLIDTGINRTHPSFAAVAPSDGYTHANPRGRFYGHCGIAANQAKCNNKLIGIYDFIDGGAGGTANETGDATGHGSHVGSTAVGNPVDATIAGASTQISGVAPRSNLISYRACATQDSCPGAALVAAINQAVADGVDVINYSIGGGPQDPWAALGGVINDDAEAFLAAREAGIVVAASAGNDGPGPGTHGNPANAPWVISVAAASHDRDGPGDRLADFSGRGPVIPFGVIKPDVAAPGRGIRAASRTGSDIAVLSGTSMASPHVAGAALLLSAARPTWTADDIISALILSARDSVTTNSGGPTTPHDRGAGTIDVAKAVNAGLSLRVPAGGFLQVDADTAENLNLPSLGDDNCITRCTLTRNFTGLAAGNWQVVSNMPASVGFSASATTLALAPGQTAPLSFTFDVSNPQLLGTWVYGSVTLRNSSAGNAEVKLPVALYASPGNFPTAIVQNAQSDRGFIDIDISDAAALPSAKFAATTLATGINQNTPALIKDPTNRDPYDNIGVANGTFVESVSVPANAGTMTQNYILRVDTSSATADDIDLFVGSGATPTEASERCRSISADDTESCSVTITQAAGAAATTYWVLIQNFGSDTTTSDIANFSRYLLLDQESTDLKLVVTGPGKLASGSAFKLRVAWNDPSFVEGQTRVGLIKVQPDRQRTAFTIPVTLNRQTTAVSRFALANGAARTVSLPANGTHDGLFFDVPASATSVTFRTQSAADVDLYLSRSAFTAAATVDAAPPVASANASAVTASGNETITLTGQQLLGGGRWYVTPVNKTAGVIDAAITATIDAAAAVNTPAGHFYNPSRSGHGIFYDTVSNQRVIVWYTYLQDGTPTWYYIQGDVSSPNRASWSGPIFRSAWDGNSNILTSIGTINVTEVNADNIVFTYNIDGETGSETFTRLGAPCPSGFATNGHWFSPSKPGFGYSVQLFNRSEFFLSYIYDAQGIPRWITSQPQQFNSGTTHSALQLNGFCPLCDYVNPNVNPTQVGTLTRTFNASNRLATMGVNVNWTNGVTGAWSEQRDVTNLTNLQACP